MAETNTPPVTEETQEKDPAWYRDQLKRKDSEIEELRKQATRQRTQLLESAFKTVGLDPTKQLGKAIAERYDGEPTAEALREFAINEYAWEPPADDSMAGAINQAQRRVNTVTQETEPIPLQPIDLQIQQAEEKGDLVSSMTLKLQKFRETQGI